MSKSRKYKRYNDENLLAAVAAVQDRGVSVLRAAEMYGVPKSTLNDKLLKKHTMPIGRPTVFSKEN